MLRERKSLSHVKEQRITQKHPRIRQQQMRSSASLPDELTESQRNDVRQLLHDNEVIFSKGEYDIGRTHLVEYRIDTGDHRPIRQPLRRQPFQHLEAIDQQVHEMRKYGIVEPAASPWA